MSRSYSFFERITNFYSILSTTLQIVASLMYIAVALGIGSAVIGYFSNVNSAFIMGILVSILSIVVLLIIYRHVREKIKSLSLVYSHFVKGRSNVKILLKEIIYQYFPDGQTMKQHKRFKLRALQDGVESFTDRYKWTGTGKCIVKSLSHNFEVVNERKEEFWNYFDVQFPSPLKEGEEADFVIEWDLFDEKKTAVRFLSTMIDFPTEHLSMQVILPDNLTQNKAFCCSEYRNYLDRVPIRKTELQRNSATKSINYEIPKPKLYHKYLIDFR